MGSVFRQKGRSTWMINYYRDGRPIFESSGTDIKDDARCYLHGHSALSRASSRRSGGKGG